MPDGTPTRIRDLSQAEWSRLQEEAEELQKDAPATMGVVGMSDYEETGSEPDASAEGAVSWWWSVAEGVSVPSVRSMIMVLVSSVVALLGTVFPGASKAIYKALRVVAAAVYSAAKGLGSAMAMLASLDREVLIGMIIMALMACICWILVMYVPRSPAPSKRSSGPSKRIEWPEPAKMAPLEKAPSDSAGGVVVASRVCCVRAPWYRNQVKWFHLGRRSRRKMWIVRR